MGYRKFYIIAVIRTILMIVTIFLFVYLFSHSRLFVVTGLVGLAIIIQTLLIIRYVTQSNRYLTRFLDAVKYSEFTQNFEVDGLGKSFDELKSSFNNVIEEFQKIRNEKEEQYFFLQNVIHHIGVSMLAYDKDGNVEMFNNATKRLFRKNTIKNIKELADISPEIVDVLLKLKTGERTLIRIQDSDDILQLIIFAKEFKIRDQIITLVSIQNIQDELEEKEMEAWQNLIRVLTHEIMNSITPIVSLTSTANSILSDIDKQCNDENPELPLDTFKDLQSALKTINKRSTGLMHFVETYRNLTKIPRPEFSIFKVSDLYSGIATLLEQDLKKENISLKYDIDPLDLELTADEELIDQVLINLVKNSIHALEGINNPAIRLHAYLSERGRIILQVEDNGQGIIADVLDKIFIPFFTTKQGGSGIGLSLSRQILRLHGGTISARSLPNEKTVFTIRF